jgi:hypothetical protein
LSDAILESKAAIVSVRDARLPLLQSVLLKSVKKGQGIPETCEYYAVADLRMICGEREDGFRSKAMANMCYLSLVGL